MSIYLNDWADGGRELMMSDFGITEEELFGAEVIVASYTYEDYSGDAYVLFRRDGKLWEVHGSHCSCYSLGETNYWDSGGTQWQPEETTRDAILHRLDNGAWGEEGKVAATVRAALTDEARP